MYVLGKVVGRFIFSSREISKILIFFELRAWDGPGSAQNLEPQGLAGKILRNKGLAPVSEPRMACIPTRLRQQSSMLPSLALCGFLGKGCSLQAADFSLWKVCGKRQRYLREACITLPKVAIFGYHGVP
jgi:hypothetical protein